RQMLPGGPVTEELRDVDQDHVEEERELLGVHLEVVAVVRVAGDVDDLHPPLEAAAEGRALVPAEVEPAAPLQVREKGLEVGVAGIAHEACSAVRSVSSAGSPAARASRTTAARAEASRACSAKRPALTLWPRACARMAMRRASEAFSSSARSA